MTLVWREEERAVEMEFSGARVVLGWIGLLEINFLVWGGFWTREEEEEASEM